MSATTYKLSASSPCREAGSAAAVPGTVDVDFRSYNFFSRREAAAKLLEGDGDIVIVLSGRNVESIANNIRSFVQDFEYPDEYFTADFERRAQIIDECSQRVSVDDMLKRVKDFVEFQIGAEEKAERDRFEREVESMVRQLNAGRAATERAAQAILGAGDEEPGAAASSGAGAQD